MDQHRCGAHLTAEGPRTKGSSSFMSPEVRGWGRGHGGKTRRGRVLGAESEWGKVSVCKSPHSLPHQEAFIEGSKEDLRAEPQVERPRKKGLLAGNANILRA